MLVAYFTEMRFCATGLAMPLTPEQQKRIEENRAKALAIRRAIEQKEKNNEKPLASPQPEPAPPLPAWKRKRQTPIFEYDLSKMVDTRGGFLAEDKEDMEAMAIKKFRLEERVKVNMDPRKFFSQPFSILHGCSSYVSTEVAFFVCNKLYPSIPKKTLTAMNAIQWTWIHNSTRYLAYACARRVKRNFLINIVS